MAFNIIFATIAGPNEPLSAIDTQFLSVAALGAIPCIAVGTNAIALTPLANTPTISSYPDLQPSFVFAAQNTSTGAVTINVSAVGARNAYKWNGSLACGSGDIIAGQIYRATPLLALNAGAGGFVVDTIGVNNSVTSIEMLIPGAGSPITTGNKGWIQIPFACTIFAWRVLSDQSGSIVVDILRASAAFPTVSMVGAGNKPTLTAQQFNAVAPSGWTSTQLNPGDWIAFNVISAATVTQVTVDLDVQRL